MKLFNKKIILFLFLVSFFLFFLHLTTKTIETFFSRKQRRQMSKDLSKGAQTVGSGIVSTGQTVGTGVVSTGQTVGTGVISTGQTVGTGVVSTGQTVGTGVVDVGQQLIDTFNLNILSDLIKGISNSFNQISNSINNLGQPFEKSVSLLEKTFYTI
jgi:hypothetical protein